MKLMQKFLIQHNSSQIKKQSEIWRSTINLMQTLAFRITQYKWLVQIWERCKPLQLISPVNTDHAMFIWKRKPDSSFSRKLSRYQNRKILLSLNVIALSKSYVYQITLSLTWIRIFFCKIAFTLNFLFIMFIRMFDIHWKSNNICNTSATKLFFAIK